MKSILQFLGGAVGWLTANLGILSFLPHIVVSVISAVSVVLGALGIHGAAGSPLSGILDKLGRGWKTGMGVIVAVAGYLLGPDVYSTLGAGIAHVVTVLGTVLTALGLYHKQAVGSNP